MTRQADILIVEDSPTQAEALQHLLQDRGYRVRVAADGEAAFVEMRAEAPDLVVTDVVMPGMNGYELCTAIKSDAELHDVPVILLTSLSDPEDVVRSLQSGADNFIRKPYEERYLLSRISNILASRELRPSGRLQTGLEVVLAGETHFINADRQQILDFLLSTYEEAAHMNADLAAKNVELESRQAELERTLRELDAERRRAQELAKVNAAVLDATAEGIVLVVDGTARVTNRAFRRLLRTLPALERARSFEESVMAIADTVVDRAGWLEFIEKITTDPLREGGHTLELAHPHRCFRVFTTPVDGVSGATGRLFVFRDITAEREADRLKDELMSTVSHELRTPLASIYGFSELMTLDTVDPQNHGEYARIIHQESRRLTELINNFLDLQRIEEGALELERAAFDLAEVLQHATKLFSGQSEAHRVVLEITQEPLEICGDRGRIAQVVANLVSNAIKYSPEGGTVTVAAQQREDVVRVTVSDEGLGIPAAQQDRIFTKFFRVDSSDTRRIGGTGLGLALSRQIVDAHAGRIGFDSTHGVGTTFWFELPAAAVPPEPAGELRSHSASR